MEFGEIVSAKVVTDRNTKKSLGYGFVKFLCEDDAKLAIQRLNGFTIDNKCLKVSVARPASLEIRNCKLYVTNLPKDYTEIDVIHLFQEVSAEKIAIVRFPFLINVFSLRGSSATLSNVAFSRTETPEPIKEWLLSSLTTKRKPTTVRT